MELACDEPQGNVQFRSNQTSRDAPTVFSGFPGTSSTYRKVRDGTEHSEIRWYRDREKKRAEKLQNAKDLERF